MVYLCRAPEKPIWIWLICATIVDLILEDQVLCVTPNSNWENAIPLASASLSVRHENPDPHNQGQITPAILASLTVRISAWVPKAKKTKSSRPKGPTPRFFGSRSYMKLWWGWSYYWKFSWDMILKDIFYLVFEGENARHTQFCSSLVASIIQLKSNDKKKKETDQDRGLLNRTYFG